MLLDQEQSWGALKDKRTVIIDRPAS
jgi:hypothetical protein